MSKTPRRKASEACAAVLMFLAETEDIALATLREYINEEKLMQSALYQEIFKKGEARGEARARAWFGS